MKITNYINTSNIFIFIFLMCSQTAFSQDTPTDEIEVFKAYQPILADAYKLKISPTLPPKEEIKLNYQYQVPQRLIQVSYAPPDLKPIAYNNQKELENILKNGFIKLGIGNQVLPYVHAGLNYNKNNLSTGIYASYQNASLSKIENQNYSDLDILGFVKYNLKKEAIEFKIGNKNQNRNFYGYKSDSISYEKKDVAITYNTIHSSLQLYNITKNKAGINHAINIPFYVFTSKQSQIKTANENGFGLETFISKTFTKKHVLRLDAQFHSSSFQKNTTYAVGPHFTFFRPKGSLQFGIQLGHANDELQVLPYTYGEQYLISNHLIFFSGYKVDIIHNSLTAMTQTNPWLALPTLDSVNSIFNLKNPIKKYAQFGIKGNLANKFDYRLNAGQHILINDLFFENDTTDARKFRTSYDKNNIFDFEIDLNYKTSDKLLLGWNTHFYTYKTDSLMKAWHRPSITSNLHWRYQLNSKIEFGNQFLLVHGMKAYDKKVINLKTGFDVNLFFNYRLKDNFMFFVQANNILNQQYQTYLNYQVLGMNFSGGVKYSF